MTISKRLKSFYPMLGSMILALSIVGCGGQTNSSGGSSTSGVDLTYVTAQIDKYKSQPTFMPPGPAFDASKAKGKLIFNIPFSSELPFNKITDDTMATVAKQAGVQFINYSNQGQPSQQLQGIQTAIARKADLIFLEGAPDPALFGPQLMAAHNAGIPVVVSHFYDASQSPPGNLPPLVVIPARHNEASRLEADYAIRENKGNVHALIISANEISPSRGMVAAIQDEFKARCGSSCTTTVVDVAVPDFSTKVQSEVQSALVRDPKINYVIPFIDGLTQFAAPGILAAGRSKQVKIVSYNGSAFVLKMIQDHNIVSADIGEDLLRLGYSNMDQALRVLSGAEPVKKEAYALRVWDSSNVNATGTPPDQTAGYGNDFIQGFPKLWGLQT
ncbi:sugar ABC transporter substrate-binding protein [Candidatus Nephthysia bennettiae]|uniref:Sugar ABC transporter substrate-binding protein n=1 Tax=Candidatus Nephthysia bennettiae TaxID=3127016 RepID=A0A934K964_9BACT|nr:sugar ABC transporter substrate-binding protein [Candidatus Dormibacteraeota bacterium]